MCLSLPPCYVVALFFFFKFLFWGKVCLSSPLCCVVLSPERGNAWLMLVLARVVLREGTE